MTSNAKIVYADPVFVHNNLLFIGNSGCYCTGRIAALARVAPFNRDSGTLREKSTVWWSLHIRAFLYMGVLVASRHNPVISIFYQRLLAAGKPKKVALTAFMYKLLIILNAILKHHTSWQLPNPQLLGSCS